MSGVHDGTSPWEQPWLTPPDPQNRKAIRRSKRHWSWSSLPGWAVVHLRRTECDPPGALCVATAGRSDATGRFGRGGKFNVCNGHHDFLAERLEHMVVSADNQNKPKGTP